MTWNATPTAAFSYSDQAPLASRESRSEARQGHKKSRLLLRIHHQVPSLVRAARRKCHQRPFRSAPHFRPEPQSPRQPARAAAAAGASRDRSGRARESQTAPSSGREFELLPMQRAGRAGTAFPGFFPALPPSDQAPPFQKYLSWRFGKLVNANQGQCPKKGRRCLFRRLLRTHPSGSLPE